MNQAIKFKASDGYEIRKGVVYQTGSRPMNQQRVPGFGLVNFCETVYRIVLTGIPPLYTDWHNNFEECQTDARNLGVFVSREQWRKARDRQTSERKRHGR